VTKIAEAFVEIRAEFSHFNKDIAAIKRMVRRSTGAMHKAFGKAFKGSVAPAKRALRAIGAAVRRLARVVLRSAQAMGLGLRMAFSGISGIVSKAMSFIMRSVKAMARFVIRWAKRAAIAMAGIFTAAMVAGAGFDRRMSRVKGITKATSAEFYKLEQRARELGRSTIYTASQVSEAMSVLAVAGFSVNEIITAMGPLLNLAAAGQLSMAEAGTIVVKIMRGMGVAASDVEHALDVMVKAFTSANTNLSQLGEAFKYVGPLAVASGKSLEEITATLQVLGNAGIQASLAGTAVRNMLVRLAGGSRQSKKQLDELGISISKRDGGLKHLADVIDEVGAATAHMDTETRNRVLANIAGLRGIAAFTHLVEKGGDHLREFEKKLQDAGGSAKNLAADMIDNLWGAFTILKSATQDLGIEISNMFKGDVRSLVENLTVEVNSLTQVLEDMGGAFKGAVYDVGVTAFEGLKDVVRATTDVFDTFFDHLKQDEFDDFGDKIIANLIDMSYHVEVTAATIVHAIETVKAAWGDAIVYLENVGKEFLNNAKTFFTFGIGSKKTSKPKRQSGFWNNLLWDPEPDSLGKKKQRGGDLTADYLGEPDPHSLKENRRADAKEARDLAKQKAKAEAEQRRKEAKDLLHKGAYGPPPLLEHGPGGKVPGALWDDWTKDVQTEGEKKDKKDQVPPPIITEFKALIETATTALGAFKVGQKSDAVLVAERQLRTEKEMAKSLESIDSKVGKAGPS
jgi:TP901 family phage tail tape measure protein